MSVEWAVRCPALFLLWCSKRPHEIERGLQSPENFTMVKNKENSALLSYAFTLQTQVCFLITDAFYALGFIVNIEVRVASKKRFFLWKGWDRLFSSICLSFVILGWQIIDVSIAYTQVRPKYLQMRKGEVSSWWSCNSGNVFLKYF